MENAGVYIHFPFCKRKCFYCHFVKYAFNAATVEQYVDAAIQDIHLRSRKDGSLDSIYFGGGSPSLMSPQQLARMMAALSTGFNVQDDCEITLELNPEDVTPEKLKAYKSMGINRLSLGTQSFLETDLHYLKRTHGCRQSLEAIESVLACGFPNFSIDFIISLPTQKEQDLEESFKVLKQYPIPHISAYILEGVQEENDQKNARDFELYHFTRNRLQTLGYQHYEVSNFSKPGYASRHNLKYWQNREYIGVGASASGFEDGIDYRNYASLKSYFKSISEGKKPHKEFDKANIPLRRIVMGLRLYEGIHRDNFQSFEEPLAFLLDNEMLVSIGENIALHPQKMLLLNEILTYFLS